MTGHYSDDHQLPMHGYQACLDDGRDHDLQHTLPDNRDQSHVRHHGNEHLEQLFHSDVCGDEANSLRAIDAGNVCSCSIPLPSGSSSVGPGAGPRHDLGACPSSGVLANP